MADNFRAMLVSKDGDQQSVVVTELAETDLMDGDVTVAVEQSTVNYKDGLAISGKAPIIRKFPLIPGIDLSGRVLRSEDPRFQPGDRVVANGFGLDETHHGATRSGLVSRVTGSSSFPIIFRRPTPWRLVPPGSPPCFACWR